MYGGKGLTMDCTIKFQIGRSTESDDIIIHRNYNDVTNHYIISIIVHNMHYGILTGIIIILSREKKNSNNFVLKNLESYGILRFFLYRSVLKLVTSEM